MFEVKLKGDKELERTIKKLSKCLEPDEVESVFLKGAKAIARDAKSRAPRGPTGNLKKAIVAKTLRRIGNKPAPAIAAVDYGKAPHAHLVEYGTGPRYQKKTGRYTGQMPARPFFRPAWDENKDRVLKKIVEELEEKVERAMK